MDEGKDLGAYIIAITPTGKPKPTEEQAKAIAKFLYDGKDVKAFAAAGRSFGKLEVTEEQLKKCKARVLFIHGGNESDYVKDRVAAVHKLLGRGEVKIVEGADHITTLAKPEFASALHRFPAGRQVKIVRGSAPHFIPFTNASNDLNDLATLGAGPLRRRWVASSLSATMTQTTR